MFSLYGRGGGGGGGGYKHWLLICLGNGETVEKVKKILFFNWTYSSTVLDGIPVNIVLVSFRRNITRVYEDGFYFCKAFEVEELH